MTGQQVREWMARWGVTQQEMAKRLHVSQPRVCVLLRREKITGDLRGRIEKAMRDVKAETAKRARALIAEEVA